MDANTIEIEMNDLQMGEEDDIEYPSSMVPSSFRNKGYSGLTYPDGNDVEGPGWSSGRSGWLRSRIRRQNRSVIICALTLCIGVAIFYVGSGLYMSDEEINSLVEPFESESGTVTNDADNGKMQQSLDAGHNHSYFNKNHNQFGKNKNPFADKITHPVHQHIGTGGGRPKGGHGSAVDKIKNGGGHGKVNGGVTGGTGNKKNKQVKGDEAAGEVDESDVYCEDLMQYSDWMEATVTKADGPMFNVLKQMDHDPKAFTQGLTYARGNLYESTGLYGESTVRILDRETAELIKSVPIDNRVFGEGMTYCKDKLIQITWKSQRGFVYNISNLEQIDKFKFSTTMNEGWGITWDRCNDELIVTDGSQYIHFWDPETLVEKRKLPVTRMDGSPAVNMNEVEYWRGRILANVWYEDVLLVINPTNGVVEKEYDFSSLFPYDARNKGADCFNGISVSNDSSVLYVTGKKWNRMFAIELLP